MPTANKDTKITPETNLHEPQKLVQNLVDKKIRNLEKRKSRLQELQQLAEKGQALEPEQQRAVKKLDQVVEMIDLMKDLNKSIAEVLTENTKQLKKQQKKEMLDKQIERQQQEIERLKTIIRFQDILGKLETTVRQDFSKGTNGAIKLTEDQLNNLDQLFAVITDVSDDKIETTTEKLIALADGKSREAWPGVTFHQLKELMVSIVETKYFKSETPAVTELTTTTATVTNKSSVVPKAKSEEPTKKFAKENHSTNNTTKTTSSSTQFHSIPTNDFNQNLNQLQSQFTTGISFMTRDSLVDKDPAVVAVASVPNAYSYQSYGLQTTDSFINTSIPDSTNTSINPQKTANFENTSSISTIPTQTFTNQQFAALIPGPAHGAAYAVPVTLATVPITGLVAPDMTGVTGQMAGDMIPPQTFGNHPNFMNSSGTDKQSNANPSHERVNNYTDDHRNNRNSRNRSDPNKKNTNGVGGRGGPRNTNKGQNYGQNQNQMFGNYNPKYDNQQNGSSFGNNTFGEQNRTSNNNFNGNRGRPQRPRQDRQDRPRNNPNPSYNSSFGTAAAK